MRLTWVVFLGACSSGGGSSTPPKPSNYPHDDQLRLNEIQALGSHNSYDVQAEPKRLPAGTVLRGIARYDNSANNPANPDPGATVRAGPQSTDEMFNGYYEVALADQDAGPRGLFVDFFGRPASTHKAVALMAMEFDAVLVVIGVPRLAEPMFYAVVCGDVIDPREYAGRGDAVRAITQRYTTALEGLIRRYPEQYFWLHRRWKHQPKARVAAKAA